MDISKKGEVILEDCVDRDMAFDHGVSAFALVGKRLPIVLSELVSEQLKQDFGRQQNIESPVDDADVKAVWNMLAKTIGSQEERVSIAN